MIPEWHKEEQITPENIIIPQVQQGFWFQNHSDRDLSCSAFFLWRPSGHSFQLVLLSAAMTHWHYSQSGLSDLVQEKAKVLTQCSVLHVQ